MQTQIRKNELDQRYDALSSAPMTNSSLKSFLRNDLINDWLATRMALGPTCEMGCGATALLESLEDILPGRMTRQVEAFDLSTSAINKAKAWHPDSRINYYQHDVLQKFREDSYQVIIDAHCLHTLQSLPELFQAMGNIHNALAVDGLLFGEVMMAHKNMSFESGLEYSSYDYVLYKHEKPSRVFMQALEWEDFFINCGFSIEYFMCQSSIKFIPHDDRDEAMASDPECLRFVLKKKV
jgi:hypothetical protein